LPDDVSPRFVDLGEVRLHYVEQGSGPLVVLLHGFPEFWYGWRHQLAPLAEAGFRVVAPDMRGYNLSSRPAGVSAYAIDRLAADVSRLVDRLGADRAHVAGHDWGGAVAWATAAHHPEVVERLAVLNCPHPRRMLEGLRGPRQLAKSWYMLFFQLPLVPERALALGGFRGLRMPFDEARAGSFSESDLARYVSAWSQPGALQGMVNYYRAAVRRPRLRTPIVEAPTMVIWGERDSHLSRELAEPHSEDVPRLEHVVRLPQASHWVQHDEPERVGDLLVKFFAGS
jgi:epoxide hydrolase 4